MRHSQATQEIECDEARRTFRAEVCAEKNSADADAYLLARWALVRADAEQHEFEGLEPELLAGDEGYA